MPSNGGGQGPVALARALEDHSAEGVQILFAEPAPLLKRSLFLVLALVVSLIVWAFVGHADVIVTATGVLSPEEDVRRVYSPAEGELEGMLVREGDPVSLGDPVARVRSRDAIQLAAQAQQAELELANVELEQSQFSASLALLEQEAELLQNDLVNKQAQLDREIVSGSDRLKQEQVARLKQARGTLEQARNQRNQSQRQYANFRALSGAAVSEVDVEQARIAFESASAEYQQADANLRALELQFINEAAQDRADLEALRLEIEKLRIQIGHKNMEIEQAPKIMEVRLAAAQAKAESSRQIRFEQGIGDNVLVILSPVDGIVTQVTSNQTGDKVFPNTPVINVAPRGSRKVLKVDIAEQDRGFLVEGSVVKIKFNAFPYQQHGFIDGTLEYISPTTQRTAENQLPAYRGFVSLERDHFIVRGETQRIRYGMSAIAEIVVRERRLIDMLIDPIRGL